MSDGFDAMVDAANALFPALKENNNKVWFETRKAQYVSDIKKPAEMLAGFVAEDLGRSFGAAFRPKVFRIYRDVRFSKDKTPYNTHLHVSWTPIGQGGGPTWFFGLSPTYFLLGLGLMGLSGDGLARFRAYVDSEGDRLRSTLDLVRDRAGAEMSDWGPAPLKRVPKPYAPDHPHADLLKRKAIALHAPVPGNWREIGLLNALRDRAEDLAPVYNALREAC